MSGQVKGGVRAILRIEGLCLLIVAGIAYHKLGFSWASFAIFFLTPDLSFFGYLLGPRIGAFAYNCAHSLIGALLVLGIGFWLSTSLLQTIGLIWLARIGFDRALGYGLKYSAGFGFTHLGLVGKNAKSISQTTLHK
ncbi:MAG: hypothetical protein FD163_1592 [Hyphomonadaceae bacterium]|nr:MAG: hypothetical protein FD128_112 [Hyphomonadaceae bacterium]KAF0184895.1 MAG: hypothetical protein FD163_1592 [Hyphomonadaceae bacterium]